jgi:hypothetical protein
VDRVVDRRELRETTVRLLRHMCDISSTP